MNAMRTRVPENRRPAHPGELLERLFLDPLDMTQTELAERLAVPYKRVNSLINGRRSVTAETALLLARLFDTTPEYWMNMQAGYDLWEAQQGESRIKLERVEPISS